MKKKYGTVTEIRKEFRGHFCFEPITNWVAYCYSEQVAQARTKAECISEARQNGYSVPKYVL